MVGIILALIFRAIFIAVGYTLVENFSWVFYIFGAFLIYTAVSLVRGYRDHDEEEHPEDNRLVKFAQDRLNVGEEYRGLKLWWNENGVRVFSPMLIVIVALGVTDIIFALDSIPAIFGITQEPYLVFTANVFALMGLRQLYFLLGGLLRRLVYLSLGLAFILAWIGVKLIVHALYKGGVIDWEVPTLLSLAVIIVTLTITAVLSLLKTTDAEEDALSAGDPGAEHDWDAHHRRLIPRPTLPRTPRADEGRRAGTAGHPPGGGTGRRCDRAPRRRTASWAPGRRLPVRPKRWSGPSRPGARSPSTAGPTR